MAKRTTRTKSTSRYSQPPTKTVQPSPRRTCGCLQAYFRLLDKYPEFRLNQARLERFTQTYRQAGSLRGRTQPITIPVVVHVVFRTDDENISDVQIKSQIEVLNKDFTATNSDLNKVPPPFKEMIGNSEIKFELATRDSQGNATNGITRTQTQKLSFSYDDGVKSAAGGGIEPWATKEYLNIWVCTLGDSLLGYAQFPGGPPQTDGVVILNTAFGTTGSAAAPFHKGRTATHEIGHYLNLSHIWGEGRFPTCDDSDYLDDTPNQFAPNTGKPTFPQISCDGSEHGDMFMNYMDYVDDEAMFMFTAGQVSRMRAALAEARRDLGASPV